MRASISLSYIVAVATLQRIKQATSKLFLGSWIMTSFHASGELHRGPEFFFMIDYN